MAEIVLTEKFMAETTGRRAMMESRVLLAGGCVSEGIWNPPNLARSVRIEA